MSPEEQAAQKAHANRLRAQIDVVTGNKNSDGKALDVADSKKRETPESPQAFTQRRMREIAEEEKKKAQQ